MKNNVVCFLIFWFLSACGNKEAVILRKELNIANEYRQNLESNIQAVYKANPSGKSIFTLLEKVNQVAEILDIQKLDGKSLNKKEAVSSMHDLVPQIEEALYDMESDVARLGFSNKYSSSITNEIKGMQNELEKTRYISPENIEGFSSSGLLSKYHELQKLYQEALKNTKSKPSGSKAQRRQIQYWKKQAQELHQKLEENKTEIINPIDNHKPDEQIVISNDNQDSLQTKINDLTVNLKRYKTENKRLNNLMTQQEKELRSAHRTQLAKIYYSKAQEFHSSLKKLQGWRGVAANSAKKKIYRYSRRAYDNAYKYGHKSAAVQKSKLDELKTK